MLPLMTGAPYDDHPPHSHTAQQQQQQEEEQHNNSRGRELLWESAKALGYVTAVGEASARDYGYARITCANMPACRAYVHSRNMLASFGRT